MEAIAEFEALLAWHSRDVPAMLQLGLAEKARGELDAASAWLERACGADPGSAVARFYAGEVFYNRGLNDAALGALRDAIARNPDYAEAHYLLAFVYGDLGQHEAAREATRRAIALNPTLAKAQANLALERFTESGRREDGGAPWKRSARSSAIGFQPRASRRSSSPALARAPPPRPRPARPRSSPHWTPWRGPSAGGRRRDPTSAM